MELRDIIQITTSEELQTLIQIINYVEQTK